MEAQLKLQTLGQSLVGPCWMDELSASQFCDEDQDFMQAQTG